MPISTTVESVTVPQRRPRWSAWLMLSPLLVWLAAFVVAPNLIMLAYSFGHKSGPSGVTRGCTWKNSATILLPASLDAAADAAFVAVKWLLGAVFMLVLVRVIFRWRPVLTLRWT